VVEEAPDYLSRLPPQTACRLQHGRERGRLRSPAAEDGDARLQALAAERLLNLYREHNAAKVPLVQKMLAGAR
jgi:hypothetical protein